MKRFMIIPFVFLLCFTFGCQQAEEVAEEPVVDVEADIEAIKKISEEWSAAFNAGNIDKLVSLFTDDAVRIPPNKPVQIGKEAIRGWIQWLFDQVIMEHESELVDVKVSSDLAFFRCTWAKISTPKDKGESRKHNGNYVSIVQKQPDGSWKIICNSWSHEQLILPLIEQE